MPQKGKKSKGSGIYIRTEEHKRNISNALKGKTPKFIPDLKGRKFPERCGENHPMWKGKMASYVAIHSWVKRRNGKAIMCVDCGTKVGRIEWANIDHQYKRNLNDWQSRCTSCHRIYDIKNNNYGCGYIKCL